MLNIKHRIGLYIIHYWVVSCDHTDIKMSKLSGNLSLVTDDFFSRFILLFYDTEKGN